MAWPENEIWVARKRPPISGSGKSSGSIRRAPPARRLYRDALSTGKLLRTSPQAAEHKRSDLSTSWFGTRRYTAHSTGSPPDRPTPLRHFWTTDAISSEG